jgi:hypothetical protein
VTRSRKPPPPLALVPDPQPPRGPETLEQEKVPIEQLIAEYRSHLRAITAMVPKLRGKIGKQEARELRDKLAEIAAKLKQAFEP